MKIAIPINDKQGLISRIADHFGRCSNYLLLNEDKEIIEIVDNLSEHGGGQGLPPEFLKKQGVDTLLCKGIGIKAIDLCKQLGIQVFVCSAETAEEIFNLWKKDKLKPASAENAC